MSVLAITLLVVGALIAAAAIYALYRTRQAERDNPPLGKFVSIDGARLHYIDRGKGPPLVLLHGNGSMIQDFHLSGLIEQAAKHYRVIVFDRPGYGHSTRPRDRASTRSCVESAAAGAGPARRLSEPES
jgi:alpha-beta hydrolase superfamily lysophospholipase